MGKTTARWALYATMLLLVGCDHATKTVAKEALSAGRVVTIARGWLDLRYAENFDTAFSLTRGWGSASKGTALCLVAIATTAAVLVVAWKRRNVATRSEQIGMALVLAGAVGNTLDRVRRGYVVDFIHVHHWPVFNVADVLVVAGAVLLATATLGVGSLRAARSG